MSYPARTVTDMGEESLAKVLQVYERRGTLERIIGDTTRSAVAWLDQAADDLMGVDMLLDQELWRLAYRNGYDVLRNAAESIVTAAGFRVRGGDGSHEAVFVVAHELVAERSAVFNAANMGQARQRRHAAQYIDVDRPTETDEADARRVAAWAHEAVAAARDWLGQ
jgi:hypothetical protein